MPPDSFSEALGELDPASRALLDLSLRRGMRPEEIGDLLGTDPESVIVARENALEQLAALLGIGGTTEVDAVRARLAELPGEAWTPKPSARHEEEDEDPPARQPLGVVELQPDEADDFDDFDAQEPPDDGPAAEPATKSRLPLLLGILAIVAIALVVLLVLRGGDDGSAPQTSAAQPASPQPASPQPGAPKPAASAPSSGPKVGLTPIAGTSGASGTGTLADGGKRLLLTVKGLPDPGTGSYQVWLYDSVIDARSIGSARGRDLQMDLRLPASATHYRSVDISLEPRDGNPNHSGQSVLRVPLAKLSR